MKKRKKDRINGSKLRKPNYSLMVKKNRMNSEEQKEGKDYRERRYR